MIHSFVAFDVETATNFRSSICEIGISCVDNMAITERKSWLIQPPGNKYNSFNTYLHGIGPENTASAPTLPNVWPEIREYIQNKLVACHYSAFDMAALREALDLYGLEYPTCDVLCTIRPAKKTMPGLPSYTLDSVFSNLIGREMQNHHHAEDDAVACAEILIECIRRNDISTREDFENIFRLKIGHLSPDSFRNQHAVRSYEGKSKNKGKAADIVGDVSLHNPDSYFYGKTVCFTGAMSFSVRKDLQQYIANVGGSPVDAVTKKTEILVVGQQDFRVVGDSGMSSKQRKALDLLGKGQDIEILSEAEFLRYADDFNAVLK